MTVVSTAVSAIAIAAAEPSRAAACGEGDRAGAVCLGVFRATGSPTAARLSETVLVTPTRIAFILVVAFVARRLAGGAIERFTRATATGRRAGPGHERVPPVLAGGGPGSSARRRQRAETIGALLHSVTGAAVWSLAVLMALSELGLNLGPLIAGAGIVGVAVGFGAQHLVRDFVSGVFMLAEDQYGVGDVIDAGPATGTVEGVSLRTTRLRAVDGTVWHLPNGGIDRVGNLSQQWARAVLDVHIAYGTDVPRATEVVGAAAGRFAEEEEGGGRLLDEPEVWGVEHLGADGVVVRLVARTAPGEQFGVARELRARVHRALGEAGIEIPFPQRTLWHHGDGTVPAVSGAGGAPGTR